MIVTFEYSTWRSNQLKFPKVSQRIRKHYYKNLWDSCNKLSIVPSISEICCIKPTNYLGRAISPWNLKSTTYQRSLCLVLASICLTTLPPVWQHSSRTIIWVTIPSLWGSPSAFRSNKKGWRKVKVLFLNHDEQCILIIK